MIENCPVTGVKVREDDLGVRRVKAVETPHGTIETPCVVNCAGEVQTRKSNEGRTVIFIFICFHLFSLLCV